jgi:hypothetical protein
MVLITLVDSPFNHLTELLAGEHVVTFSRVATFKLCVLLSGSIRTEIHWSLLFNTVD